MTEPAARGTFSATVTQWAIYDAYEEERINTQGGSGVSTGTTASVASPNVGASVSANVSGPAGSAVSVPKPVETTKVSLPFYISWCINCAHRK
jgi:hypothetical protein